MKTAAWFFIEPFVFISIKGKQALLYNTLDGQIIEEQQPDIIDLVRKSTAKENLLVLPLTAEELNDPGIANFIEKVREHLMGELLDVSYSQGRPIEMMPTLKIHGGVEKLKKGGGQGSIGEGIMNYLSEISLYINGACEQNCSMCGSAYKQFPACTKGDPGINELPLDKIEPFLQETGGSGLYKVNVLGGDTFAYSKFEKLTAFFNRLPVLKVYFTHYLNLTGEHGRLDSIETAKSEIKLLADFPAAEQKLDAALSLLKRKGIPYQVVFVIRGEAEVDAAQEIAARSGLEKFSFIPFYDGKNLNFFKKAVFLSKEDILELKPGQEEIFARQVTNPLHFGSLVVLSSGAIHADINTPELGKLGESSLYDIVYKELYDGGNWRRLRTQVEPCKDCTFELLCPPLTDYEYAVGQNNLCHIRS